MRMVKTLNKMVDRLCTNLLLVHHCWEGNIHRKLGTTFFVPLCRLKKNENGQRKENTDLGKKQRKSKQIGEKNESGGGATGRKIKLKQAATSNENDVSAFPANA